MIKMVFTAANGIPFAVRVVRVGEQYGRCGVLVADRPLVEFYDARYTFEPGLGQFVTRYWVSTVLESSGALCLDGGVNDWNVDADSMRTVRGFVQGAMAAIVEAA